ncbi:hypothetical protein C2G38_264550 [Gigaspora rosea]|uniref:Uncharacterized protein n=1 Tax=Gigaspora rosea TaxID=44941 RepID=A0A397UQT4_9GLOM|nr:hypothetical protein C2G38_264550 [Gigaspora rosea]
MNNSQSSVSMNTFRTKRSYSHNNRHNRQCGIVSWIFMPLRRGSFLSFYKSHSFHNDISFKNISIKQLNEQEIQEQLQKAYQKASDDPSASIEPRQLIQFWQDYCIWLSKCKNLEDSQSQREYWTAKEEFKKLNRAIKKDLNQNRISWAQFQPPIPKTTQYLSSFANKLIDEKLGLIAYLKWLVLLGQLLLNIVFITRQFELVINFPENDPISDMLVSSGISNRNEFIRSATGIGFTLEFAFLLVLLMVVFGNLLTLILSHSILNRVILFQNTIKIIQEIAEFSLFKFIHFLNLSAFVNEFHEPPSLDLITDLVKFKFKQKQWEPYVAFIYKLFYTIIARPTFLILGLVALYIKLLLVSKSLVWIQQLKFDLPTVWKELVENPFSLIIFLGLANNIAGLYGIPSMEERQAFFENHRIHEYDFTNALMHEFVKQNKRCRGFWNIALYTVGVNSRDLNDIFWESIYGDNPNIFEDEIQINDIEESPVV